MNDIEYETYKEIEGVFDGENLWGEDSRIYPVPANYASKSKLIEGDRLRLYIQQNGQYVFKQIELTARKRLLGVVTPNLQILAEGRNYNILHSSITYHKAKPGDEAAILIPADGHPTWAALENIIQAEVLDQEMESELI